MRKYAIVQHITRFFRPPGDATRQPPTFVRQLVGLWLFALAFGAGLSAIGWDSEFGMALLLLFYGDIIDGVRYRWTAILAAVTVLAAASGLTRVVLPGSLDDAWAQCVGSAVGVTLGLAVSAAITRLPERRPHRPAGDTTPGSVAKTLREGEGPPRPPSNTTRTSRALHVGASGFPAGASNRPTSRKP